MHRDMTTVQNDIDIILPVYNERVALEQVLQEWSIQLKKLKLHYCFIICEDGSTDGTKELLQKIRKKYPIKLNQKSYRRGYGPSVIDGIISSHGSFILCIDSDGQCDPSDFATFWKERKKDMVCIGWRISRADVLSRKIYSGSFKQFFSILFPHPPHDPSAPYVLFSKKKILPYLHYLTFLKEGFWWGFVGTCIKWNIPIKEFPINHRLRIDGKTQVYTLSKMPSIAFRNIVGLVQLRIAA